MDLWGIAVAIRLQVSSVKVEERSLCHKQLTYTWPYMLAAMFAGFSV